MQFLLGKRNASESRFSLCKRQKLSDIKFNTFQFSQAKKRKLVDANSSCCSANKCPKLEFEENRVETQQQAMTAVNLNFFSLFSANAKTQQQQPGEKAYNQLSDESYYDNLYWKEDLLKFDEASLQNQNKLKQKVYSGFNNFQYWKQPYTVVEDMDFDDFIK